MTDDDLGVAGLRFEREGVIGWCIIDRPEARNALTGAMYYGIKKAVIRVNKDPDLAALIITGSGDVFAPGGDLGGREPDPRDAPVPEVGAGESLPFTAIRESRKPVIAAVNGICQGGGLLIAMMADIAVVSDQATFRVPELLRGIIDATYAATPSRPRRPRGGTRPAVVGSQASTRPRPGVRADHPGRAARSAARRRSTRRRVKSCRPPRGPLHVKGC